MMTGEGEILEAQVGPDYYRQRIKDLEDENKILKSELAEAEKLNRQLTVRLFVDGVGDKDARTSTGMAGEK